MRTVFDAAGDVRAVDLLAALVSLWRGKESGAVRFFRAGASAGFDFADGEIVAIASSEPRFETSAILVRAGKLDPASLERLTVPPGGDAAVAAVQAGVLTRREWKWGEKIRAIEILSDLLAWPDGEYAFDFEARPAAGEFTLGIPRLVLELFLRSRDRNLIEHQLGPTDVPLARSPDFESEFATFGLTADAESVVRLIDGRASADEISRNAPADEFAVTKLLAALATLGLVRPAESAGEADVSETPPPSPRPAPRVLEPEPDRSWESSEFPGELEIEHAESGESSEEGASAGPPLDIYPVADGIEPPPPQDPEFEHEFPEGPGPVPREDRLIDQPLAAEVPAATLPLPEDTPPSPSNLGVWLVAFAIVLAAAIGVVVIVRSRADSGVLRAIAVSPTAAQTTPPAEIRPTAAAVAVIPTPAPTPPPRMASGSKTAAPAPRPTASRSRATPAPPSARPAGSLPASREEWVKKAERERARVASEPRTRYSVQLELACEPGSLTEAWKYDRPAGSLWILPTQHAGRTCFRVLWGRYPTLAAARAAKSKIPGFFSTATNHPAVVAVR